MSTGACQDLWHIIPWFVKSQISCWDFLCVAPRQGKVQKKNKCKTRLFRQKNCFHSSCNCLVPSTFSASMWLMSLLGSCIGKAEGNVPSSVMEAVLFGALTSKFVRVLPYHEPEPQGWLCAKSQWWQPRHKYFHTGLLVVGNLTCGQSSALLQLIA